VDAPFIGYDQYGKPYDVQLRTEESIEDMVRFVSSVMEYTLQDTYTLSIAEFFRDWRRARETVDRQRKQSEKWQTK